PGRLRVLPGPGPVAPERCVRRQGEGLHRIPRPADDHELRPDLHRLRLRPGPLEQRVRVRRDDDPGGVHRRPGRLLAVPDRPAPEGLGHVRGAPAPDDADRGAEGSDLRPGPPARRAETWFPCSDSPRKLVVRNSSLGRSLVNAAIELPFLIWLMKNFFDSIPR